MGDPRWFPRSPRDPADLARGLTAHLDAGADQVGVYPLGDDPIATLLATADAVLAIRPE